MDVCSVIKARLQELELEQKDLAAAAEVTESYISQLLTRKKLPPAPDRTDIYEKMGRFLRLSNGWADSCGYQTASWQRWPERSGWTSSDAITRSRKKHC